MQPAIYPKLGRMQDYVRSPSGSIRGDGHHARSSGFCNNEIFMLGLPFIEHLKNIIFFKKCVDIFSFLYRFEYNENHASVVIASI